MRWRRRGGIVIELLGGCRGIFLDQGELEPVIDVEGGEGSGIVGERIDPPGWIWTAGMPA